MKSWCYLCLYITHSVLYETYSSSAKITDKMPRNVSMDLIIITNLFYFLLQFVFHYNPTSGPPTQIVHVTICFWEDISEHLTCTRHRLSQLPLQMKSTSPIQTKWDQWMPIFCNVQSSLLSTSISFNWHLFFPYVAILATYVINYFRVMLLIQHNILISTIIFHFTSALQYGF